MGMTRSFFNDVRCWMDHMRLDNDTGIDPPGIKLRAAEGEARPFCTHTRPAKQS